MITQKKPLKPAQHAEHTLLIAILDGTYKKGHALPGERVLSEQIGVTRPTLRETLQRMQKEGWITIRHGKPTLVNDYLSQGGMSLLSTLAGYYHYLPKHFIAHFLELRTLLFPEIVKIAAEKNKEKLLDFLKQSKELDRKESLTISEYDWNFQILAAEHSGNPLFKMMYNDFQTLFLTLAHLYFQNEDAVRHSLKFYRKLTQEIERNSGNKIKTLVRNTMKKSSIYWKENTQ